MTVQGDQGLREGEVWFVEGDDLTFWSTERLLTGRVYEMRVDTRTRGENADIEVKIRKVMVGRSDTGRGYLHIGTLMPGKDQDLARLRDRFWSLNPEHAPPGRAVAASTPPRSDLSDTRRRRPKRADSRSHRSDVHEVRGRSRRARMSAVIADGGERRRSREEGCARPAPRPSPQPAVATAPAPSVPPDLRLVSPGFRPAHIILELGPGDPPNALLRFASPERVKSDVHIEGTKALFYTAPDRRLQAGTRIVLHIQLPFGSFLQLRGKLTQSDSTGCIIEVRSVPLSALRALELVLAG